MGWTPHELPFLVEQGIRDYNELEARFSDIATPYSDPKLAAINGQGQMAVVGDKDWPELSRMALAPGQGRDQWAQQRALVSVSGSLKADQAPSFRGFKVSDYSQDNAIVTLAVDYPEAGLAAYPVQMTWLSDDWRVVLPTQEDNIEPTSIDNLDGFTPYSNKEQK